MVGVDAIVTRGPQIFARHWIGLAVGFIGIVVLVWPDITAGGAGASAFAGGVIAVQVACAGWAVGSAYTRRHVMPGDVLGAAAIQMFAGGMFMLLTGTLLGEWTDLSFTLKTFGVFVYLTLLGSVVAFASYSYALRHLPIAVVSLYTYINPVIAVVLGAILLGEPVGMRLVVAAAMILTGMAIVGRPKT
jgi:drug/metabolite transporter (DMT)-like permease